MLEELEAVLERIKNTPGSNDKSGILSEFKDNANIRNGLYFLFNTFIVTGLSTKKINKDVGAVPNTKINNLEEAIVYLKSHKTGTDMDIANIQAFIARYPNSETFLKQYLTKTYKCGITAKTVNKAFDEEFIPVFACQLAHSYSGHMDKVKGKYALSLKLDGHRTIADVDKFGNPSFFTRKGKPLNGLVEVEAAIKEFATKSGILGNAKFNSGFVLDGEGIANDPTIPKKEKFRETGKILRKDGVKRGIDFQVFDIIPREEFFKGESTDTYLTRRNLLDSLFSKQNFLNLPLVPTLYIGEDTKVIGDYLKEAISEGEEGIMINLDETYKTKRHAGILKVKEFVTDDMLVTGIYEGKPGTKYEGKLGGILVRYKDGIDIKVGYGFSDKDREIYFKDPEQIIGKVAEIQYFEESSNQNGGQNLRFAGFVRIREDKTEEDVNIES